MVVGVIRKYIDVVECIVIVKGTEPSVRQLTGLPIVCRHSRIPVA